MSLRKPNSSEPSVADAGAAPSHTSHHHSHKSTSQQIAAVVMPLVCGLIMGVGLGVGGMTDSRRMSSFFNVFNLGSKWWDPSLMFTFAGALLPNFIGYWLIVPRMAAPIAGGEFSFKPSNQPAVSAINSQLVVGSALFGAGWAIGGFCPGPAIVATMADPHNHYRQTAIFVISMLVGMAFRKLQEGLSRPSKEVSATGIAYLLGISAVVAGMAVRSQWADSPADVDRLPFFQPMWRPFVGGILIGTAVLLMNLFTGQILGVSGLVSGLFSNADGKPGRLTFILGLVCGGLLLAEYQPDVLLNAMHRPWFAFVVGGLLVGYGTVMANGCTSGHGVAGLSRLSPRSMAAVGTFMAAQFVVTSAMYKFFGFGASWQNSHA